MLSTTPPSPPRPDIRPYDALVHENVLTITVRKEFDAGSLAQDWARKLALSYPGPFKQVMFDLSHCGLGSSTFFAGLLQLHSHYNSDGNHARIRLLFPDPRIVRNLKVMRFDLLFHIVPREASTLRPPA